MRDELITQNVAQIWSSADARSFVRVSHALDDELLGKLVESAERYVLQKAKYVLAQQTRKQTMAGFPATNAFSLDKMPVTEISTITYYTSGGAQVLAANEYGLDAAARPQTVYTTGWWPTDELVRPGVEIQYVCGYVSAETVPDTMLGIVRLLVAGWYENREAMVASAQRRAEVASIPFGVAISLSDWLEYWVDDLIADFLEG